MLNHLGGNFVIKRKAKNIIFAKWKFNNSLNYTKI
jgi:hypothetical protein